MSTREFTMVVLVDRKVNDILSNATVQFKMNNEHSQEPLDLNGTSEGDVLKMAREKINHDDLTEIVRAEITNAVKGEALLYVRRKTAMHAMKEAINAAKE
jgi:hypothetical protein